MYGREIYRLITTLSRLPGIGPRSARRLTLYLLKRKDVVLRSLIETLTQVEQQAQTCSVCFSMDTTDPCYLCRQPKRAEPIICVVADVLDLWALERSDIYKGRYHVLGGVLSAVDGVGPENLKIKELIHRIHADKIEEVVFALSPTIDGQTTLHYLANHLKNVPVRVTTLAQGVPLGGDLDFLDNGTLNAAFQARQRILT